MVNGQTPEERAEGAAMVALAESQEEELEEEEDEKEEDE